MDTTPVGPVRRFTVGPVELSVAGGTVVGNRYPANFDVLHVDTATPFAAVVDGMGGSRGSAVAGSTAMSTLVEGVHALGPTVHARGLRAVVAGVQSRVRAAGAQLGELTGCTLTALVVEPDGGQAWIVQVGDSRAYRLRHGLLELLTVDHTMAWLGAVNGWYPADSPAAHTARYQLTRYVGHPDQPEPDLLAVTMRLGDTYLLCTDGVAEQVDYHRLRDLLGSGQPPEAVVGAIMADSLAAGGHDNATAVVVSVR